MIIHFSVPVVEGASYHEVGLVIRFVTEHQVVISFIPVFQMVLSSDHIAVLYSVHISEGDPIPGFQGCQIQEQILPSTGYPEQAGYRRSVVPGGEVHRFDAFGCHWRCDLQSRDRKTSYDIHTVYGHGCERITSGSGRSSGLIPQVGYQIVHGIQYLIGLLPCMVVLVEVIPSACPCCCKKQHQDPNFKYEPESDDEEELIALADEEDRLEAERLEAERKAAQYYTVKSGDTLSRIAVRYHTTINAICKLNNITAKSTLRVGQRLRVK